MEKQKDYHNSQTFPYGTPLIAITSWLDEQNKEAVITESWQTSTQSTAIDCLELHVAGYKKRNGSAAS